MTSAPVSNRPAPAPADSQAFTFPASFAQRRLWFLDQLTPGDVSYNVPGAVEIEGEIDTGALERSLQEIVRRHESLRTLFQAHQGEAQQVIHAEVDLALEILDLCSLPDVERLPQAERLTRAKSISPFDLQHGPLFRATLLRLGEHTHRLVIVMHHIISDGWSIGILVRELAEFYDADVKGRPAHLPELPIQYVDYTAWQHEQLSGEHLKANLEYWKGQLEGVPGLQLVTDHPRGEAPNTKGAQERVEIGPGLTQALRLFAQEHGVTLYMALLAALQTLLFRYSGQREILVGSPIAGRTLPEVEELIGFFVNTLVLKAKFHEEITFRQLLRQLKETTLEAYAHQDLPFEKMVEELSLERNLGRTPFFQTMFGFQNTPMPELQLGSAKLRPMELESETAKFELTLSLGESGNRIKGTLEYSTDLFNRETITRFFRHYTFLLESLLHDPDLPVSQAALVDEEERSRLEQGWSSKILQGTLIPHKTWTALIAEHAGGENKPAVITAERQISYQEFDRRANEIAVRLQAAGIPRGAHVAVCASQVGEMVVAILGILKAGAVAVPIDPEDPALRLQFVLKDADATSVVTAEEFAAQLKPMMSQCLVLSSAQPPSGETQIEPRNSMPEDPALLIYQSGESGQPEATVIPHRGLLPRTFASDTKILPSDIVGVWPSLALEENGILELLRCLSAGAAIVQFDGGGTPRKWTAAIREQKVTVLYARSSEAARLARKFSTTLKGLRLIVCTEKGADLAHLTENLKAEIAEKLFCVYGRSETCGWCALYPLTQHTKGITEFLAVGTKIALLDTEMNPLPEGIVGEVFVGGEHLSLGYYNLPQHTKAAFPRDEYSSEPGATIYRSGDTGYRRSDGTLQMGERNDGRAWIAGVRVEAAEIEAALKDLNQVQDSAVLVEPHGVSVFLVSGDNPVPELEKVQTFLAQKLPKFMLPDTIHSIEFIPRLSNGDVDRPKLKSLALQLEKARRAAVAYAPPESELEWKLAAILQKTLGRERVGRHDDFFRMGGHSLLATQVVAQISHEFKVEVPLRKVFETPTVAQLAAAIAQFSGTDRQAEAIPQIHRVARVPVQQSAPK
jgi:non-ribosomal peptide synthetase component F/acyl carrier protein